MIRLVPRTCVMHFKVNSTEGEKETLGEIWI
jgi:hypothetical protein